MSTQEKDSILSKLVQGRLISGAFFVRYWLQIFIIVTGFLIYMTNRYSCQNSMSEIKRLNERLSIVQSESYRVRGEYMSRIRESEMRRMADTLHLGLSVQSQPPYHISDKK